MSPQVTLLIPLLTYKCSNDTMCTTCERRMKRGLIRNDYSIGCTREKLYGYMPLFIPGKLIFTYKK
jgi:hypothetical protein